MTLATVMTNDLAAIFSPNDFAVSATYRHGAKIRAVNVIFDRAGAGMGLAGGEVEDFRPQATCRAADIEDDCDGDRLIIDTVTYYIRERRTSEDGLIATLILSRV